jgi:hypothetical protein
MPFEQPFPITETDDSVCRTEETETRPVSYEYFAIHSETLPQAGSIIEVLQGARHHRSAVVETVSEDGTLIWLAANGAHTRTLFHRDGSSNVWTSS